MSGTATTGSRRRPARTGRSGRRHRCVASCSAVFGRLLGRDGRRAAAHVRLAQPGCIAFTRIPSAARSLAAVSVNAFTAAFDSRYGSEPPLMPVRELAHRRRDDDDPRVPGATERGQERLREPERRQHVDGEAVPRYRCGARPPPRRGGGCRRCARARRAPAPARAPAPRPRRSRPRRAGRPIRARRRDRCAARCASTRRCARDTAAAHPPTRAPRRSPARARGPSR